jgi:TonB family protein
MRFIYKLKFVFPAILFVAALVFTADAQVENDEIAKLNKELVGQYTSGSYDAALITASKLVDLSRQKFGKDDLATAEAWKNKGIVENAKGSTKEAETSFEKAVDIFEKHPTMNEKSGSSFADVLETLGGIKMRRQMIEGESNMKLALKWREKSNGPDAAQTATPLASLANISFWQRDYKKSAELFTRALANLAKAKTDASEDITVIYYRAQCAYRKAKMETDFESIKRDYESKAEFVITTKPADRKAKLIHGGVLNGKALSLPKPRYPAEARQANAQGTVEVSVLISETGSVLSACAANNAHPALMENSEISAYNSKFSPTTLQGSPVKVSGRITYNFRRN